MALIKADRVKETSTSTGTGTFALAGAATGYRTFSSVCAIGDTFYYAISNQSNGEWESGLGTYSAANTLTRTTVHASSNSGNAVTFSAGTKEAFLTLTARHLDRIQDNGQSTAIGSKTSVVAVNDSATLPDLDLQFADLKTLTAKYGPTPSYSRASIGYYTNASGVLTSAAINEPRFDHVYENGAWVSKGLLIEEQRTNLCTYSEDIANASWNKFNSVAILTNDATSPNGTLTADRLYPTLSGANLIEKVNSGLTNGATYSYSYYAKSAGFQWIRGVEVAGSASFWVDVINGVVGTVQSSYLGTPIVRVTPAGNGWFKISVTSVTNSTSGYIYTSPADGNGNNTSTPSGTNGILYWGFQFELGSFATSYIPNLTTGSTTRSADVCQITGSAFTNLWNATEGTLSVDWDVNWPFSSGSTGAVIYCNDGTTLNRFIINNEANGNNNRFYINANGFSDVSQLFNGTTSGYTSGARIRYAAAYKVNDFAFSSNGLAVTTDNSQGVPTFTTMTLGDYASSQNINGHISRLRYFRSRLDNTQLVNLSGGINTLTFKPVTGSGSVTVANEYTGINISVPNPLPITNGGTGAQTQLNAVTNLVGNPPNDGGQYTLASKKTSGTPTFYWVDGTGYAPTLDLLFAADKSLTAYKGPTPSFSRASTGSYFDSTGVLRYAVLNTLLYSEQFDNGYWVKSGISVSANATVAPDGKSTADKVLENTSSGIKYGTASGGFSVVSGTTYTFSVYAKDSGRFLGFATNSTGFPNAIGAVFNLSSGTISNIQANTTASIQNVGDGWYRCIITGTANATATSNINFGVSNDVNQIYPSYTGNGSNGYFLWGIQMETGSTANSYVQTAASANSAPRFNHTFNGTSWVSKGLLLEEQRTNFAIRSNTFSNAAWEKYDSSISSSGTGPDGSTASLLTENTANGAHWLRQQTSTSVASGAGVSVTASIFVKANGRSVVGFGFDNSFAFVGKSVRGRFDLSDESFANEYNCDSYSITNVGNGWYRLSVTSTAVQAGVARFDFFLYNSDTSGGITYTGDGSSGVLLFGAQVEAGAFPSSYIGTTNSSVVRSSDVCQITGTDFSGFWNGTEGSFVADFDFLATPADRVSPRVWYVSDGVYTNGMWVQSGTSDGFYVYQGGSSQAALTATALGAGVSTRIASAYKLNDFAASFNGAAVSTDTSGNVPTVNRLEIGYMSDISGRVLNGHIARLRYYPVRLPNATLQVLST